MPEPDPNATTVNFISTVSFDNRRMNVLHEFNYVYLDSELQNNTIDLMWLVENICDRFAIALHDLHAVDVSSQHETYREVFLYKNALGRKPHAIPAGFIKNYHGADSLSNKSYDVVLHPVDIKEWNCHLDLQLTTRRAWQKVIAPYHEASRNNSNVRSNANYSRKRKNPPVSLSNTASASKRRKLNIATAALTNVAPREKDLDQKNDVDKTGVCESKEFESEQEEQTHTSASVTPATNSVNDSLPKTRTVNNIYVERLKAKWKLIVETTEDIRELFSRCIVMQNIADKGGLSMSAEAMGIIAGVQSKIKRYQKIYIALKTKNASLCLPSSPQTYSVWVESVMGKKSTEIAKSIKKPGQEWPKVGELGITQHDVDKQKEEIGNRMKEFYN